MRNSDSGWRTSGDEDALPILILMIRTLSERDHTISSGVFLNKGLGLRFTKVKIGAVFLNGGLGEGILMLFNLIG